MVAISYHIRVPNFKSVVSFPVVYAPSRRVHCSGEVVIGKEKDMATLRDAA